jgi:hypothetical protein
MGEPFDIFADAFIITLTPWGVNLSFQLGEAHPSPQAIRQPARLGTVRMSIEHLKAMVFMFKRQVQLHEKNYGVNVEVPTQVLSQLGIAREDWDAFWR